MELEIKAFIPIKVESINKFLYAYSGYKRSPKRGGRWCPFNYKYIKYYKKWEKALKLFFPKQDSPPGQKKKLIISLYKRRRLYDQQNFIAGAKPIVDILVKLNYFQDDSVKWIDIEYHQYLIDKKSNQEEGTLIEIYKI